MADAQAMTIPEQAVKAALDKWRDHEFDGTLDNPRMRAALTAAAPHMSGVKVKQLEWVDTGQRGFLETEFYAVAGSLMHTVHPLKDVDGAFNEHYSIHRDWNDREVWRVTYYVGNNGLSGISKVCKSLEAAKAAAQADYEKRILSALELSSARDQALEEAETQGNLKQWNIQDHLKTPGSIAEYLQATLDEGDSELLINAVSDVIRALKSQPAQVEKLLAAERMKLEAAARVGLQLSEQIEVLQADNASLIHDLNRIKDHETSLVNDNEAKNARIEELERRLKEVELEHTGVRNSYFAERRKARALEADNKRLREALEPFADVADLDIGIDEDDRAVFWPISSERHSKAGRLRVGDLRRARTAPRERE